MASTEAQAGLSIEVCYAHESGIWRQALKVPAGATLGDALAASGFQAQFPEVDPARAGTGVFGLKYGLDHVLHDGDRIEVYRPLVFDPKESRRRRAQHRAAAARKP